MNMKGMAFALLVCATTAFGAVDAKQCAAYRRDTVPKSIKTALDIGAHLGRIPPEEEKYLSSEFAAAMRPGAVDSGRMVVLVDRPYYMVWWYRRSLAELIGALKAIDAPAIGESVDAHRAKGGADALHTAASTASVLWGYFNLDMTRQYPGLPSRSEMASAYGSLITMQGELLWFAKCTIDTMGK
ncbi:hypothetical protein PQR71_18125 [Paraburkholderia fungorum]|uniref:hypothetical protein n=1 Tax=Paraburkholderia fungorum TaxID=134537 RepID=UPI0038B8A73B